MTNSSTDGDEPGSDPDSKVDRRPAARGDPIERKIQLPGGSTYAISLPKAWALERNLEAGMSMYLYAHQDRLVVAPAPVDGADRSTRIDCERVDRETIPRRIEAAYAAGCDRIALANADALDDEFRRTISRTVATLVGMEIHEETTTEIVARTVLDAGEISLPQTVAQIRQLALEMHAEAIEAVRTDDAALARRVIDRDDDVDRLFAFVSRGFYRGLEDVHEIDRYDADRSAAFLQYRRARQLERIADHAERIAGVVDRQSGEPDEEFAVRLEAIASNARDVVSLAFAGEADRALELCGSVREELASLDRELYEAGGPDAYLYGTVLESVGRTAEYGVNVVDATIEASARGSGD